MKIIFIVLLSALALLNCKKEDNCDDYTDDIIGLYSCDYVKVFYSHQGGLTLVDTLTCILDTIISVEVVEKPNQIKFLDWIWRIEKNGNATYNGCKETIDYCIGFDGYKLLFKNDSIDFFAKTDGQGSYYKFNIKGLKI